MNELGVAGRPAPQLPVLGVDPGTQKCGYALVAASGAPALEQGIVALERFGAVVASLRQRYGGTVAALGSGTHCGPVELILRAAGLTVVRVDERETTLRARSRYFKANPPRGWKRLIPQGMLVPPGPIDDFAAILIAERYLAAQA